jgi:regulator of replication initiation timing
MNLLVEKLAAVEKEAAGILSKIENLFSQTDDFNQKVAAFAGQSSEIAAAVASIRQEVADTQQGLKHVRELIAEAKSETEDMVANQDDNQQRCETMTAVFREAFHAASRLFETAQHLGFTDQAKTAFLPEALTVENDDTPVVPTSAAATPISQPAVEEDTEPETSVTEPEPTVAAEPVVETEPIVEAEPVDDLESILGAETSNGVPVADIQTPPLPDVTSELPTEPQHDLDADEVPDSDDTSDSMASNLDVQPLNLEALPSVNLPAEPITTDPSDEQEIEDMLTDLMKPVTA